MKLALEAVLAGVMVAVGTYVLDATFWGELISVGSSLFWASVNGAFAACVLVWYDLRGQFLT